MEKNQKKWKNVILSLLLYIIVFFLLYNFIKNNISDISQIKNITLDYLLYSSFFVSITLILLGIKTKLIVNHYGIHLSKTEWLGLGVINTFWNYIFLKGGVMARAVYLKKKNLSYSNFSSIIIVTHVISLMLFSFLSFIVFVFASFYFQISLFEIIIFFLILFFAMILVLRGSIKTKNKILKIFLKNKEGIRKNKPLIIKLVFLEFIIVIIYALRLKIIGNFFNYDIPITIYFLTALFSNISVNILNLIPGGLGIKEAGAGFIFKVFNFNLEHGIIITLIDRIIAILIILPLGIFFNLILLKTVHKQKKV